MLTHQVARDSAEDHHPRQAGAFYGWLRTLKLLNIFTFRFTTVSGLNTNDLEPLYHRVAKDILDGVVDSVPKLFERLQPTYVIDEQFRKNFESLDVFTFGRSKQLVKYILCRLEEDQSGRDLDFETDTGTIEHILPESPVEAWSNAIPEADWPKLVYRLGNLTLLESSLNRRIGNSPFLEKVSEFAQSRYQLTRQIAADPPEEWTAAQINARQAAMARRAVHLWRSDFDR